MGIGKKLKKAAHRAGGAVRNAVSSSLVQRAGAVVAPIALLPGLANKGFRTNTGPIYAAYAAVGAGALGAAAAGLTGTAILTAGAAPAVGVASTFLAKSGVTGAAKVGNADPWTDTNGSGGGGGGDGSGYGSGIGSQDGSLPVWAYVVAGVGIIIAAVVVAMRGKKKSHV